MLRAVVLVASFIGLVYSCTDIEDPIKRDEGEGPWNVSRVQRLNNGRNGKLVAVDLSSHPLPNTFYEGDSYVLQYSVRAGRKPDVIYYWQGSGSSRWEKGASAILTVQLDNDNGGVAKQARVVMGEEPGHFLKMFDGAFVTLLGGVDRERVDQDTDGTMLFKVTSECNTKGDKKPLTRTNQVPEQRGSVNANDVFILKTPSKLYIYEGQGAYAEEKTTAQKVVESLYPGKTPVASSGANPSAAFLAALK
eukprot:TRINITY_DN8867_c0_g1_i1.p1 TRINITY_DN8867_c0_g1~~TRINITY_DN8867_c0_g1_i1.p1  ORF type:complete len:249 (-),score=43.48 TRINITY_DN8867_c0_g1_i1:298-1044(-)